jgi:hypothetical protein
MDEAMAVHVSIDKLAIGALDAVVPNMRLLRLALLTTVPANELVFHLGTSTRRFEYSSSKQQAISDQPRRAD